LASKKRPYFKREILCLSLIDLVFTEFKTYKRILRLSAKSSFMNRLFTLFFCLILISCTEDGQSPRSDETLFDTLTAGQWQVTFFELNGQNQANLFEGINFNFIPNGQVEAYRGTQLLDEGIWSTRRVNRRAEFELSFSDNPLFETLNGEWYKIVLGFGRVTFREISDESENRITLEQL